MDDLELISNPRKIYEMLVLTSGMIGMFAFSALVGYKKDKAVYQTHRQELNDLNEELKLHSELCTELDSIDYARGVSRRLARIRNKIQDYSQQIQELPLKVLLEPSLKRCYSSLKDLELRVGLLTGAY